MANIQNNYGGTGMQINASSGGITIVGNVHTETKAPSKPKTKGFANKLILPMYSCRDKVTGEYKLLTDSNFHSWFNVYLPQLLQGKAKFAVPELNQLDLDMFYELETAFPEVEFVHFRYGSNPRNTRIEFFSEKSNTDKLDKYDAFAIGITMPNSTIRETFYRHHGHQAHEYLMNVSTQTGISQPIDSFNQHEWATAEMFDAIWCHDQGQIDHRVSSTLRPTFATLSPKKLMFRPQYYQRIGATHARIKGLANLCLITVRLSDPEYDLYGKILPYIDAHPEKTFAITDINSFLQKEVDAGNAELPSNAFIRKLSKKEYYGILAFAPEVLYTPHDKIWHVGKNELELFGCKLITI